MLFSEVECRFAWKEEEFSRTRRHTALCRRQLSQPAVKYLIGLLWMRVQPSTFRGFCFFFKGPPLSKMFSMSYFPKMTWNKSTGVWKRSKNILILTYLTGKLGIINSPHPPLVFAFSFLYADGCVCVCGAEKFLFPESIHYPKGKKKKTLKDASRILKGYWNQWQGPWDGLPTSSISTVGA